MTMRGSGWLGLLAVLVAAPALAQPSAPSAPTVAPIEQQRAHLFGDRQFHTVFTTQAPCRP